MSVTKIDEIYGTCPKCGGDQFSTQDAEDPDAQITCNSCGAAVGSLADFEAGPIKTDKTAVPDVDPDLKDVLKVVKKAR
jgi:predicted  nucleic acid-binding Zn-ribbon protein